MCRYDTPTPDVRKYLQYNPSAPQAVLASFIKLVVQLRPEETLVSLSLVSLLLDDTYNTPRHSANPLC
jgi:hypothetical protein